MRLTKAEYDLLDALNNIQGGQIFYAWLKPAKRTMAKRMRERGLLSKRAFAKGLIEATAAGRRTHGYGVRP